MRNLSTTRRHPSLLSIKLNQATMVDGTHADDGFFSSNSGEAAYQFLVHPHKKCIYSAEQLIPTAKALQLPLILHKDDLEIFYHALAAQQNSSLGGTFTMVARLQALGGLSWISCRLEAKALPAEYKETLGWHVVVYEINHQVQALSVSKDEQLLHILSQLYNAGYWCFYPKTGLLELDPALQNLLNLRKRSLPVKELLACIHPDDTRPLLKKIFKIQRKGGLFQLNLRYKTPSSSSKNYRHFVISSGSFSEQGKNLFVSGLCFDGNLQQKLQNKSLLNRAFLDEAQSLGKLGCFEWHPELNKLEATVQLKEIFGLQKEESFSREFLREGISDADLLVLEKAYLNFMEGQDTQEFNLRFRTPDGRYKDLWIRAKAFFRHGRMDSLIGIVQDVSEGVQKQVLLQAKDKLIGGFMRNLPVCVMGINSKGIVISALGTGLNALGLNRRNIIGSEICQLFPEFCSVLEQVFTGIPQSFVSEKEDKGQLFSFYHHYYLDKDRRQAVGFTLDISEQRKGQLAVAHLNQLEQRYQLMDTFVHAVAHDLRSPVVNLDMLLNFFKEESSSANQQKYVDAMSTGIQHLKRTLDALIEILRIEKDSSIAAEQISFAALIKELEHEYGEKLKLANGQLQTFLQCDSILYNKAYLSSVLRNLISNAIKYRYPERAPLINICTEKKGDVVLLLIQDNGMGMNLEKWGHLLFQPFKRLNNHQKGTGIGLHLVKQIIEKNGGKIKVSSQPGQGTTFFCFLRPYNM